MFDSNLSVRSVIRGLVFLVLVIALGLSTVFEGYQWSGQAIVGMILVLLGNVLVLSRPRRKLSEQAAA